MQNLCKYFIKVGNVAAWFNTAEECYTDVIPEAWIDNPPKLTADAEVSAASIYEILSGVTHCWSFATF